MAQWLVPGGLAERELADGFKHRRLSFGLAWLHAQLSQRKRLAEISSDMFGFSESDLSVGTMLVNWFADQQNHVEGAVQWDALRYMMGRVVHGGRPWLMADSRVIKAFVHEAFQPTALTGKWLLPKLESYPYPEDFTLPALRNAIKDLSAIESPEMIGLHASAVLSTSSSQAVLSSIATLSLSSKRKNDIDGYNTALEVCRSIQGNLPGLLEILPNELGLADDPIRGAVMAEAEELNSFLKRITANIEDLIDAIEGKGAIISELQEFELRQLAAQRLPDSWRPPFISLKPFGSWKEDLVARSTQFKTLLGFTERPKVVWLGGLSSPHAFLAAFLSQASRDKAMPLECLSFEVNVLKTIDEQKAVATADSISLFVSKLILRGAKWTPEGLVDGETAAHYSLMPLVELKVVANAKRDPDTSVYPCPVFLCPDKFGLLGRRYYLASWDLKIGDSSAESFWIKRGTCLYLNN
jgi:hypothetical protein